MTTTRVLTASAALCAVLALTACGDDEAVGGPSWTGPEAGSSSPTSSTPSDEEVFAAAEKAAKKAVAMKPGTRVPKDADWATERFRRDRAKVADHVEKEGLTIKGKNTWLGSRPEANEPDAAGGWQVTLHVCSESDQRIYKGGKDVTVGKDGKPLPKGKSQVAYLYSFSTPDEGQSWQVDSAQQEEGETCGLS